MVNINDIIKKEAGRIFSDSRAEDARIYIKTRDARVVLACGIRHFVGDDAVWLPEYELVAEWLADNKGRGLLCSGNCGRGKTVICHHVIPEVFRHWHRLVVNNITATELNRKFDEFRQYKIISLDDLGTETIAKTYGEEHNYVQELIDLAEREQKLLIISTNLNERELLDKYDVRTIDRLKALTKVVVFSGKSLRK